MFIVPVIAVDKAGNRIGWGLGYYDNLLKSQKKPIVALAYNFQVVDSIEPSDSDVKVDYVVTENEIIKTNAPR